MGTKEKALLFEAVTWYIKFRKAEDEFFRYDMFELIYEISESAELELAEDVVEELAEEFTGMI